MRKLIVETAKRVNKKLVDKIARGRELKAGVNPSNPRARAARNRIRRGAQKTAKNIYKGTAAGTGATAVGGGVAASRNGSKPKAQAPKPKPKPAPKTKATGKAFNVEGLRAAYNKAITPAKKKAKEPLGPKNQPAKKTAKMASVPTVKNPRTPTTGPKTKVPVGSSIIRNKDGSIKKINKPSGKAPKNKFDRMTTSQLNRLSGKEAAAYRKYKKAQKGKK